jgi:hypothetical protein
VSVNVSEPFILPTAVSVTAVEASVAVTALLVYFCLLAVEISI